MDYKDILRRWVKIIGLRMREYSGALIEFSSRLHSVAGLRRARWGAISERATSP